MIKIKEVRMGFKEVKFKAKFWRIVRSKGDTFSLDALSVIPNLETKIKFYTMGSSYLGMYCRKKICK